MKETHGAGKLDNSVESLDLANDKRPGGVGGHKASPLLQICGWPYLSLLT